MVACSSQSAYRFFPLVLYFSCNMSDKITLPVKYLYVPRAVCLARLALGSVTFHTVLVFSQLSRLNSAWPFLWGRQNEYQWKLGSEQALHTMHEHCICRTSIVSIWLRSTVPPCHTYLLTLWVHVAWERACSCVSHLWIISLTITLRSAAFTQLQLWSTIFCYSRRKEHSVHDNEKWHLTCGPIIQFFMSSHMYFNL